VCSIDLPKCILIQGERNQNVFSVEDIQSNPNAPWTPLDVNDILASNTIAVHQKIAMGSVRHLVLGLQREVGILCDAFRVRNESAMGNGLKYCDDEHVFVISRQLAAIATVVAWLARQCNHDLGKVIMDKMSKNEAKYPADLARGSSAKYTKYIKTKQKDQTAIFSSWGHFTITAVLMALAMCVGGFLGARALPEGRDLM
jgi:dCTP diphosphatase